MSVSLFAFLVATSLVPRFGQAPPTQQAQIFDVASVKRNESGGIEPQWVVENGRFTLTNVTLKMLLATAYGNVQQPLPDYQILDAPKWVETDRFDVAAKAATTQQTSSLTTQSLAMLRGLLEDRFHLKAHYDRKEVAVYVLSRVKPDALGPRMRRRTQDCADIAAGRAGGERCSGAIRPGMLRVDGITPAAFAGGLARFMPGIERPVVDGTGLEGTFDIELSWTPDGQDGDAPSLFTAIREQLGLKLESTKAPVNVLVIDHVEHPTPD